MPLCRVCCRHSWIGKKQKQRTSVECSALAFFIQLSVRLAHFAGIALHAHVAHAVVHKYVPIDQYQNALSILVVRFVRDVPFSHWGI